jgi:4-aminobutyrate aminotransferase
LTFDDSSTCLTDSTTFYLPNMPVPVKTSADWQAFAKEHTARGLGRMHDMVVVKGQGCKLYTMDDKEYLDFTAGIGVTNLGQ